jgi:hypothetical protein
VCVRLAPRALPLRALNSRHASRVRRQLGERVRVGRAVSALSSRARASLGESVQGRANSPARERAATKRADYDERSARAYLQDIRRHPSRNLGRHTMEGVRKRVTQTFRIHTTTYKNVNMRRRWASADSDLACALVGAGERDASVRR